MIATLNLLRNAVGEVPMPDVYHPRVDDLLRRVAERLPGDLVDDVVQLIRYARSNP